MIKTVHSYWAYLVLAVLLLAVYRAISGAVMNKEYSPKMFQSALFTLIATHTQLLIALLLYFTSSRFSLWFDLGIGEVMNYSCASLVFGRAPRYKHISGCAHHSGLLKT